MHLRLAYLITAFLHPQEIILYQDLFSMFSLVSSSFQLLLQGWKCWKYSFDGSGLLARFSLELLSIRSYRVSKGSSAVQMPEFSTPLLSPRPSKVDAVSQPVIAWKHVSSSELIYYLIHFLGEHDSENYNIGVHGVEYSETPRFHGSSVWFFLIEQRETDMAIATDVDDDDWRAFLS